MFDELITRGAAGHRLEDDEALRIAGCDDLDRLMAAAGRRRDLAHGPGVSYSRKVFVPLTMLCRDHCHYCTFAKPPADDVPAYLTPDEVVAIADAGARAAARKRCSPWGTARDATRAPA